MEDHSFGARLRIVRLSKGLTQAELGKEICSSAAISDFEHDKYMPNMDTLLQLCERLEVVPDILLRGFNQFSYVDELFFKARMHMGIHEYDQAIKILNEIKDRNGQSRNAYYHLGICLFKVGEVENAIAALHESLKVATDAKGLSMVHFALSRAYDRLAVRGEMIEKIGKRVRKWREVRQMSQEALAHKIISRVMLSKIELGKGTPSRKVLEALATRLGISYAQLVQGTDAEGSDTYDQTDS